VAYHGRFYGTTSDGAGNGSGTVFSMSPSGSEKVIRAFGDGTYPTARLIVLHGGEMYGTTSSGGAYGKGMVFDVSRTGQGGVFHNFGESGDGASPDAALVEMNGVLYGTTREGGKYAKGTVFSITPGGSEHVLHSFGGAPDGGHPSAGLTVYEGELYGTTRAGGKNDAGGAAFKIDASGYERVIHSFGVRRGDGANPAGDLVAANGVFYGTTIHGGAVGSGRGTVFEMNAAGKEFVLHSFGLGRDGAYPFAGLVSLGSALYGTTEGGGNSPRGRGYCVPFGDAQNDTWSPSCGTVFEITPFGRERVLYRFRGDPDGSNPVARLAVFNGELYGTTYWGGSAEDGGTAFRILP